MKIKVAALAFLVITAGMFVFTRSKNTPSCNDLRDAVADYNPDFNKGPELAEFLKVATDPSLQTCLPFPPIKFAAIKGSSINKPGLGSLALRPYVISNTTYRYAQKYPPLLQQTPQDPIAKELLVQWAEIDSTRGLLLDTASDLESQDSVLYAEGVRLSKDAAALKQEQVEFKAAVDAWNQQCVGQPVNEYCTNEYNRLIAWGKDLGARH